MKPARQGDQAARSGRRSQTSIALLVLLSALGIHAAEQSADTEVQQTDTDKKPETRADTAESRQTPAGTGDVFLPSEEISEDFAVSFPVDI